MKYTPDQLATLRYDFTCKARDHLAGYLESDQGQYRLGEHAIELLAITQGAHILRPTRIDDGIWQAPLRQLDSTEVTPVVMMGYGDTLIRDSIAPTPRQYRTVANQIGDWDTIHQAVMQPNAQGFTLEECANGMNSIPMHQFSLANDRMVTVLGRPLVALSSETHRIPATASIMLHEFSHTSDVLAEPVYVTQQHIHAATELNMAAYTEVKAYSLQATANQDLLANARNVLPETRAYQVNEARQECNGDLLDNPLAFEPTPRLLKMLGERGLDSIYR